MRKYLLLAAIFFSAGFCQSLLAQGNFEVQVYGSDTVAPKSMMFELHSNYTVKGQLVTEDGTYPTNHQEHETIETTFGVNNWSEVGFYIFMSQQPGHGFEWVGDHIRPRVKVPESWKWPVGVSVSTEIGYQRAKFSPDTWTWEIRPIVDKSVGRWYFAINPALEKTFHGPAADTQGYGFSPAVKVGYDFTRVVSAGVEYYGAYGQIGSFDRFRDQQHQIFAAADLNVSPKWEINVGVGVGGTSATDHLLVKGIVGRRFSWGKQQSAVQ